MTLEEKKNRAYVVTLIAGVAFGVWQRSFFAGLFMTMPVLFLGGLVVAVQDGFKELLLKKGGN